ncbi:MAG: lactonase family protein [Polyangiaceae bacterium]
MTSRSDRRSSVIFAVCASAWCVACGQGGASGAPSQVPTAGNTGSAGAGVAGTATAGTAGSAGTSATGAPFVYVGGTGTDISIYKLDAALGKLTFVKSVAAGSTPSFLAFDPSLAHLYAVNEGSAKVASFKVDPKTGDLTFVNRVDSGGDAPAFVSVDRSGKYVLVANYNGGTTRVFPIGADGGLGAPSDDKSPGLKSHMILTDAANKFAFVMNLGSDTVSQYSFGASNGTLTENSAAQVKTVAGAGPRHLAFHPNGKYAYLIAELNDTMSAFSYDATLGQLTSIQAPLSTLPAGTDGASNSCAEVVVAPSGKFVYGSNRGHDSIVTFAIDDATGKIRYLGTTPSGGKVPRSFTLSTDGKLMLVANESGALVSFSVDVTTGALTQLLSVTQTNKPQFVGIVTLPGGAP